MARKKKEKTEIVVVMDRSGSMVSIKDDMTGGFKQLCSFFANHLVISGFIYIGVAGVDELLNFAFRNNVGGIGNNFHYRHVVD